MTTRKWPVTPRFRLIIPALSLVIPAQSGIQSGGHWIPAPAFAGQAAARE